MPTDRPSPSTAQDRSSYHHGDLRRVLLEVGHRLLEETDAGALSLRAIAREAGVSRAAPYHHFADREGLLAALAADGFRDLRDAMIQRAQAAVGPPLTRMQEIGIAYVLFAFHNPHHYRLMFSGQWSDRDRHPELNWEADAAYGTLGSALGGLQANGPRKGGKQGKGPPQAVALGAWSLVHGLAMLLIDGRVGEVEMSTADVEQLARQVTRVLGRGLAGQARSEAG
jgi:AcrR family transcriptional regulator